MKEQRLLMRLLVTGLFATLIYLGVSVFHFYLPAAVGRPFVHFGNTLTVIAVLLLGFRYGSIAGVIGLGGYDLLNGYAATAWLTMIEAVILASVTALVFRLMGQPLTPSYRWWVVSGAAGAIKVVTSLGVGIIEGLLLGAQLRVAVIASVTSLPAAAINAVITCLVVPLLFGACVKLHLTPERFRI